MNLRWLWLDHFPPGLSLTREERAIVRRRANEIRINNPELKGAHTAFERWFLPIALMGMFSGMYLFGGADGGHWIALLIVAAGLVIGLHGYYRAYVSFVRRALPHIGHEVCLECGYLLRGLGDEITKCPECGAERDGELKRIAHENDLPPVQMRREDRPPRCERTASRDSEA